MRDVARRTIPCNLDLIEQCFAKQNGSLFFAVMIVDNTANCFFLAAFILTLLLKTEQRTGALLKTGLTHMSLRTGVR